MPIWTKTLATALLLALASAIADPPVLLAGRADAVVLDHGRIRGIVDWKSDLQPSPASRQAYLGQLRDYLDATGAVWGAIVYMSRGEVQWVGEGRPATLLESRES